ncbi:MAG: hypothetical protein OEX04_12990, partial [Acidimicrobiia bacterium]|nr:hypothetical protein [Acidimicrobiia bacterium]
MAGGYLSITLVPLLTGRQSAEEANEAFSSVFKVVVGVMVALTAIMIAVARPLTETFFPRVDPAEWERLTSMMRIAFGSQVFFVAGTLFMAAQYAQRRFVIPTIAPIVYNVGIIVGGLVGWWRGDPNPESFLWGGLAGAAIGNFAIQWFGAHRSGLRFVRHAPLRTAAVREYFVLAFPLMIGQSAVALDEAWPRWIGQFAGAEAISELTFARTLNMFPVGVIAQAAGVAAFPFLARLVADGKHRDMREAVVRSVRGAMAVGGLAAAGVIALSLPIVRIAYQYNEFTAADSARVAPLLTLYGISIPFWAAHQVYSRAFYARKQMWVPVGVGTAVTAGLVPALLWAANRFGTSGIALTASIGVVAYTLLIGTAWHRGGTRAEAAAVAGSFAKMALVSVAAGTVATAVYRLTDSWGVVGAGIVSGVVTAFVYLGLARLVGLEGLDPIWTKLSRRDLTPPG